MENNKSIVVKITEYDIIERDGKKIASFVLSDGRKIEREMELGTDEEFMKLAGHVIIEANNKIIYELDSKNAIVPLNVSYEKIEDTNKTIDDQMYNNVSKALEDEIDRIISEVKNNGVSSNDNLKTSKDKDEKNRNIFKNKITYIAAGSAITLLLAFTLGRCSVAEKEPVVIEQSTDKDLDNESTVTVAPTATPTVVPTTTTAPIVEEVAIDAIKYVSFDEFVNTTNQFNAYLKDQGIKNVSARSINAMQFIANVGHFKAETIAELVENNVIANDAKIIIAESFELQDVVNNSAIKGKFIDMSTLAYDKEDVDVIEYSNKFVEKMYKEDNKERKESWNDFLAYMDNNNISETVGKEVQTSFPIVRSEASHGADYIVGVYSAYIVGMAEEASVSKKQRNSVSDRMNDFATVMGMLTDCLNEEVIVENTNTKTR